MPLSTIAEIVAIANGSAALISTVLGIKDRVLRRHPSRADHKTDSIDQSATR
jgi:hypothetical protein